MRRNVLRVIVLSCVCLAIWSITKSLMAQIRDKKDAGSPAASVTPHTDKTTLNVPLNAIPSTQAQLPPGSVIVPAAPPVAMFRLKGHQHTLIGNQLKVDASADIIDSRGDVSYVWVLSAAPDVGGVPSGPATIKLVYDHQVFDVAGIGQGSPTFSEVIELPSGRHFVEVGLYWFKKDQDLSFLDDLASARSNILIGGSGSVVVP